MTLHDRIADYLRELDCAGPRLQAVAVRRRLREIMAAEVEAASQDEDAALNDPEGLWGPSPAWRCWITRHSDCQPLGADEGCTCQCGLGGHRYDMNGVKTPGCDCGHEETGLSWHAPDCVWRKSRG